ncbi:tail fiber assembly protein [uncultured Klebsiella sp.]|uniref:tail fiber assembly protein n=1 Tax=uncultured Klebsiella sp. TaxID=284011 RepID=UPI0028044859|nr:tail fiber assembly protein [uncultured Klebsiella sp.]
MLIFKNFTYSEGFIKGNPAAIFTDEDGNDWYQSQKQFKTDSLKVAFDKNGLIVMTSFDASTLAPANLSVVEINKDDIPDGFFDNETLWQFNGSGVVEYTYSAEEIQQQAELQRESLLSAANDKIKDWRTELELGIISDDDKTQLIKWMNYIKDIKSLDLTSVADKAAYDAISWPNLVTYSL